MSENESTSRAYSHYNPVRVTSNDTVGTLFLGTIALILLILFVRAQRRNIALERQLAERGA